MSRPQKVGGVLVFSLLLGGAGMAAIFLGGYGEVQAWFAPAERQTSSPPTEDAIAVLVSTDPDMLYLPRDLVRRLGLRTAAAEKASQARTLSMPGSLALEANRLARVHARFSGEVVELGMVPDGQPNAQRQVQLGDRVKQGQLLAVIWSKDLGEKKSELVDAMSQLHLDQQRLAKLEEGYQRQVIPEANVRQARRDVEADLIAVARAERTLRVWRLAEAEVDAVKEEADRIRARQGKRDAEKERSWARVEVRAPFDGVVLERNVALGDIVDTALDLFKIGDLTRLTVWANVYDNQLPELSNLPMPIAWTVRLKSDPNAEPLQGCVDMIGSVVDPTQHTAVLRGHVDNAQGKLRAGQYITATIDLPPSPEEVVVPISALVEDGVQSAVMVQANADDTTYVRRRVRVVRRVRDMAYLSSKESQGEANRDAFALRAGERVVTSGALALTAKLVELKALAR